MAVIWGLDLREMQWGKFKNSYMWNNQYHMRRTKFIIYQLAMILCVVSESLGTAALSGMYHPYSPTFDTPLTWYRLRRPTRLPRQAKSLRLCSQQQLHRHRLLQHLRRHLRRHHLRIRLLLRPVLARAPRVARRQTCVETVLDTRMHAHIGMCAGIHGPCRDKERVRDGCKCGGEREGVGSIWRESNEV